MKAQYFKFASKIMNAEVNRAHLWIHVKNHDHEEEWTEPENEMNNTTERKKAAWIAVYQIVRNPNGAAPSLLHVSVTVS